MTWMQPPSSPFAWGSAPFSFLRPLFGKRTLFLRAGESNGEWRRETRLKDCVSSKGQNRPFTAFRGYATAYGPMRGRSASCCSNFSPLQLFVHSWLSSEEQLFWLLSFSSRVLRHKTTLIFKMRTFLNLVCRHLKCQMFQAIVQVACLLI